MDSCKDKSDGVSEAEEGDGGNVGVGDLRDLLAGLGLLSCARLFRFVACLEDAGFCDDDRISSTSGVVSGRSITGVACIN